jgi:hypothetical protein
MRRRHSATRLCWMVTRTDTHSGMVLVAPTPQDAALKALKYRTMRGATQLQVASFAGQPAPSRMLVTL